jgi:hypothetical protein
VLADAAKGAEKGLDALSRLGEGVAAKLATHSQKSLCIVTFMSKYTRALIFQNFLRGRRTRPGLTTPFGQPRSSSTG